MLLLSQRPDLQKTAFEAITTSGALSTDTLALEGEVPYIMAFTKEVLRYYTPLRLAMPKATKDVVEWQGAKIPKGTMVFLNAWSCNRGTVHHTPHRRHDKQNTNIWNRRRHI
jgi:cytochrome P450